MFVLIACEESQEICKAFREKGHTAFSCDIQPCSGGKPEWHIMSDVRNILDGDCCFETMDGGIFYIHGKWDLIIAHPPCTYLSNAGARWLYPKGVLDIKRFKKGQEAKQFFMLFYKAKCDKIAIENPIPSKIFQLPKYTQTIQPYEHGHSYSKKTCLWLKNLPPLKPTKIVTEHIPYVSSGSYSKYHDSRYAGVGRSSKIRSKTFPGIAKAMAAQWG